ncbi:LysR family transcriptional regulator [Pseudidiomarina salilacus]|uniref:LysR family transcriptional regulator n=1 Tax=Pseudidiomarina salilacus TaxID=3384452 RepID=UPI00398489C1
MLSRISDMAIFAAIIEHGSFTRAAEQLEISKSAVSKAIARLEQDLKTKLLTRTTRKLNPTVAGLNFYQHCRDIVRETEQAFEHIHAMRSNPSGRITLSAPVNFGATQVAPLMPEFLQRFPEVDVDLQLSNRITDLIAENVDIAIRCGELKDSRLYFRKLKPLNIVLVGSKGYFAKHPKPQHPLELSHKEAKHQCITDSARITDRQWRFYQQGELFQVTVNGRFYVSDNRAMRAALRANLGLAYMPSYSLNELLASGEIETVLEGFMPQPVPVQLVYPERKYMSAAVSAALDFLQEKLA